MLWLLLAVSASLFWGLSYVFSEQLYKKISVLTGFGLTSLFAAALVLTLSWIRGNLHKDIAQISSSNVVLGWLVAAIITTFLAELCIGFSISEKNATLAGLIEISYPLFIVLFSWLLFKQNHLNLYSLIGGGCIIVGVLLVYKSSGV